mmetsp:Transcript_105023/g.279438  ORF Transcript_105023/g.279438 Transcript_105023/m.279438 type:complete len:238 (+) Transcript_105023:390-1103(+)
MADSRTPVSPFVTQGVSTASASSSPAGATCARASTEARRTSQFSFWLPAQASRADTAARLPALDPVPSLATRPSSEAAAARMSGDEDAGPPAPSSEGFKRRTSPSRSWGSPGSTMCGSAAMAARRTSSCGSPILSSKAPVTRESPCSATCASACAVPRFVTQLPPPSSCRRSASTTAASPRRAKPARAPSTACTTSSRSSPSAPTRPVTVLASPLLDTRLRAEAAACLTNQDSRFKS